MQYTDPSLTALFKEQFEWCKLKTNESAAIITEADSREQYAQAAQSAIAALGARPFQVMLPSKANIKHEVPSAGRGTPTQILDNFPEIVDLLKNINFVVDLSVGNLIHSKMGAEIRKGGARTLLIKEPPEALARLMPTDERRIRIDQAVERMTKAEEMVITSDAGTNLKVDLSNSKAQGAYGFCDKPGSSATWATCAVLTYPKSLNVNGDVVLAIGDIVFPFYRYVESVVTLKFKNGFVEEIIGQGLDTELIIDYFARWKDKNAYGISHVGWGLHERAIWDALTFYSRNEAAGVDGRSFEGNFLISTGPNHVAGRYSDCHFDIPMRNCTIHLDGEPVVVKGKVVN